MKKWLLLAAFALCVPAFGATTYYVATGATACGGSACSDSNNGTSKTTAWLHAPGMTGAAGNSAAYSCSSGDTFILRGGDTWGAANLPWFVNCSSVTITTDHTWFAGGSYARPIISGSGTFPGAANSNMINLQSITNTTVDDLEITGMFVNQSANNVAVYRQGGSGTVVSHTYIHGWTVGSSQTNDEIAAFWMGSSTTVWGSVVDGFDATIPGCKSVSPCAAMQVSFASGPCAVYQTYVANVANFFNSTCSGTVNFHDNSGPSVYADWDAATHGNYFQNNAASGACYIYNNYAGALGIGWTFPLNLHMGSNNSCYLFNNVYNNIGSVIGISLSTLNNTNTTSTINSFNNTFEPGSDSGSGPSNSCMILETDATAITYKLVNNQCVTSGALNSYFPSGSCTGSNCTLTATTNNVNAKSFWTTNGYTTSQTPPFSPTSGSSVTVGAGTNQTSLCTGIADATAKAACQSDTSLGVAEVAGEGGKVASYPARVTNARPSSGAWDVGAYEFAVTTQTLTVTVSGTGTGVVTSNPSGVSCPVSCAPSYANGTVVTLTANPNPGSTFTGFSGGGCPSSPNNRLPCAVTMSSAQSVTATFSTGCGAPGYPCARTDLTTVTFPAVPPQMGSATCAAGNLQACGNLTGAGTCVTDPNFGTPVCRLTDANENPAHPNVTFVTAGSGSGDENRFNCTSPPTMIMVDDGQGDRSYPLNLNSTLTAATRMYATNPTWSGTGGFFFNTTGIWGRSCPTDANILYNLGNGMGGTGGASGALLGHWDFTGNCPSCTPPTFQLDFDFTSSANCLGSGFNVTWTANGGNDQSDSDFGFGFSNNGNQGGPGAIYVAVWRRGSGCRVLNLGTLAVTGDWGPTGAIVGSGCSGGTIHNVKMFKVGGANGAIIVQYAAPCGSPSQPTFVWFYNGLNFGPLCTLNCGGHWTAGLETWANNIGNTPPSIWGIRSYLSPGSPTGVVPNASCGTTYQNGMDSHAGWNILNDLYPFMVSTTVFGFPISCAWSNEVFAINPAGTQNPLRMANCYMTGNNIDFDTTNCIGSVSNDGNYYLFTSDWMNTLGATDGLSSCTPGGPVWQASTTYVAAQSFINPSSGNPGNFTFEATVGGLGGTVQPNPWNQTLGSTTTDGAATLTNIGVSNCRGDVFIVLIGGPGVAPTLVTAPTNLMILQ